MIAVYDLAYNQPSYDVLGFVMSAEWERLQRGEKLIEVSVFPGPNDGFAKPKVWPDDNKGQRLAFQRIALPIINMLPSVHGVRVHASRDASLEAFGVQQGFWDFSNFMRVYNAGIRPLRAPDTTLKPLQVTMTLRECEHWPERNSDLGQWQEAARRITSLGYHVIVVRDTLNADRGFGKYQIAPKASKDVQARALLYKASACNLFVSNGPAWFCMALDAPILMVKPATNGAGRYASEERVRQSGVGGPMPKHQRIVWEQDRADVIVGAFRTFMEAQQCLA